MKRLEIKVQDHLFQVRAEKLSNQKIWFHLGGRIFVLDEKLVKPSSVGQEKKKIF